MLSAIIEDHVRALDNISTVQLYLYVAKRASSIARDTNGIVSWHQLGT
jgi:hypothetical protein